MKKLIVLFLLLCSGVIYFIGSGCSGEDGCGTKPPDPEIAGPTVDNCSTFPVPVVAFQAVPAQFYVGDWVTFTFTGSGMDQGTSSENMFQWTFPGTIQGGGPYGIYGRSHTVQYLEEGTFRVGLVATNRCWHARGGRTYTVTLRPGKDGKPDNPKEINTIIEE